MIVGLYTSASGMLAEASRHEAIANNLANASTTGFKQDTAVLRQQPTQVIHRMSDQMANFEAFTSDLAPAVGSRGMGTVVESIAPNFRQGQLMETGSRYDLALSGEGFFIVQTARGRRYTRAGNFTMDGKGRLVTMSGDPVLSSTGAEIVAGDRKLEINKNGIIFLDGQEAGRLGTVVPEGQDSLVKEGESLYAPMAGARFKASEGMVFQGTLERSNVNPVLGMAEMLEALRAYEMNQRAIIAQDETLGKLISEVGRFG